MKKPRQIIFVITLLLSPILATESNKDNADIIQENPHRKSCVEREDRIKGQELNSVIDSPNNIKNLPNTKKAKAHFVGDAYGWIIVYY